MIGFNNFLKHIVVASLLVSINLFAANTVITQPFEQAEAHTDNFTLSSNPTGSVFQWASSGGVNNTGYLNIPNTSSDQIWTTKQTYSIEDNGVYVLRAHYKTQGNSGYGSMGFTVASPADNSGTKGSPVATQYSLGMSFHGGGGSFFSNNTHTPVNSWGGLTGDLENSPPTWYLFELKIEDKTGGNFDLTFDIYDIDQTTGAKGAKWMDTKTLSITNTNLKAEDELYVFFGADGYRMVGIDNFEVELSDNIVVAGTQTGSTSNAPSANTLPTITSTPITTGAKDTLYTYELNATDADGDTLTWSVTNGTTLPSWLTLNQALANPFAGTGVLPTTDSGNYDTPNGTNATDTKMNIFSSGNAIHAIDGKLFFSDVEEFGVRYIDENQKLQTFFAGNGDNSTLNISSIQHDPETNTTYMGDYSAHKIVKSVAGAPLEDVATGVNWFVFSLLLDKDNNKLYAGTRSAIYEIDLTNNDLTSNKRIIVGDGAFSGSYSDTGVASTSQVNQVSSMVFDGSGDLVFVDRMNQIIRKIDIANNTIETIAGEQGEAINSGDGGLAVDATFRDPTGLTVHPSGRIYITERVDKKIRIIDTNGVIDEYATIPTSGFLSSFALSEANHLYVGTNSQIFKLNIDAELSGTPTDTNGATASQDVNLTLSDGESNVTHNFTINLSGFNNPTPTQTPINGTCGASNGATLILANVINQCSTGTASSITSNSTTYTWSCTSIDGGITANCIATIPIASISNHIQSTGVSGLSGTTSTTEGDKDVLSATTINTGGTTITIKAELPTNANSTIRTQHSITIGGKETVAISKLEATVDIKSDKSVETKADINTTQISVIAKPDGTAEHTVTLQSGKISKATSDVIGATTEIKENGTVETMAGDVNATEPGYTIKAKVVTDENGKTITSFVKVKDSDKTETPLGNTVKSTTPFEAGNNVQIEEISGTLYMKIEAPLSDVNLEIE